MNLEQSKEKTELPFSLKEKLASLQAALLAKNPGYATVLNQIHMETAKHPEYVYALSDEEFAAVVAGYGLYTKIQIDVGKATKKQIALMDEDAV